jgi:aminoglycoside phosphotransferase family enzyme/gluconate kinase
MGPPDGGAAKAGPNLILRARQDEGLTDINRHAIGRDTLYRRRKLSMLSTVRHSPAVAAPARPAVRFQPEARAQGIAALVEALRDPACYPHPVDRVVVLETHISYVLLAGEYAYKLKKPVRLPFLDFSTPQLRRRYCRDELRLNRRTAPQVYLDVVPIGGDLRAPRVGVGGPALEHAVRMRRFSQEGLFSRLAARGALQEEHVEALAGALARFHGAIAGGAVPGGIGTAEAIRAPAMENFNEILALRPNGPARDALEALRRWTQAEGAALAPTFEARRRGGFVRECHGDLHLGNVVSIGGEAVLFDGIEFAPRFRWTDVMADAAFPFMDLTRGMERLAWRFLDRYLQRTGDYEGLAVLRFYAVYRAVVRAKIAAVRAGQLGHDDPRRLDALAELDEYLELARRLASRHPPVLALMHGVSGSGKSTAAQALLEALGAVRLRSDVERKRLHGLDPAARTDSAVGGGIYTAEAGERTYRRLAELARTALSAGYPVVIDAAFLERPRRDGLREVARACNAAFRIVSCFAPPEVLRERVGRRSHDIADASEAGPEVLERQLALEHALAPGEAAYATRIDTSRPQWHADIDSFARRFHSDRE